MRRLVSSIDQLPGWAFLVGAVLLLGGVRGGWLTARLRGNPGGTELAAIAFGAGVLALVIFAVRRRQTSAWRAALHVLVAVVAANLVGIALVWPMLPARLPVSLGGVLGAGAIDGAVSAIVGAPVATAGLWLSRRYGSHSAVTERRLGVVRTRRVRVYGARRRVDDERKREAI
jgi:hypothetical protein